MNHYVLLFVMQGCSACAEYAPRFRRLSRDLRVYVIDVDKYEKHSDFYKILSAPSAVICDWKGRPLNTITGSTTDAEITKFLAPLRQASHQQISATPGK